MQDQKLGKRCQVKQCRQIDWMPMGCKYCNGTFCYNHYSIENHGCKQIQKDFKKVIECPFCLQMIKVNPHSTPQSTLQKHEATECRKQPKQSMIVCAKDKCGVKITEVNKFECYNCQQLLCMKHRLQTDHNCVSKAKKSWWNFFC